jgi:hypothetical protein
MVSVDRPSRDTIPLNMHGYRSFFWSLHVPVPVNNLFGGRSNIRDPLLECKYRYINFLKHGTPSKIRFNNQWQWTRIRAQSGSKWSGGTRSCIYSGRGGNFISLCRTIGAKKGRTSQAARWVPKLTGSDKFSPRMPCQMGLRWYVWQARILIGQSHSPSQLEWHSND